jgi:hypothetical protein
VSIGFIWPRVGNVVNTVIKLEVKESGEFLEQMSELVASQEDEILTTDH